MPLSGHDEWQKTYQPKSKPKSTTIDILLLVKMNDRRHTSQSQQLQIYSCWLGWTWHLLLTGDESLPHNFLGTATEPKQVRPIPLQHYVYCNRPLWQDNMSAQDITMSKLNLYQWYHYLDSVAMVTPKHKANRKKNMAWPWHDGRQMLNFSYITKAQHSEWT